MLSGNHKLATAVQLIIQNKLDCSPELSNLVLEYSRSPDEQVAALWGENGSIEFKVDRVGKFCYRLFTSSARIANTEFPPKILNNNLQPVSIAQALDKLSDEDQQKIFTEWKKQPRHHFIRQYYLPCDELKKELKGYIEKPKRIPARLAKAIQFKLHIINNQKHPTSKRNFPFTNLNNASLATSYFDHIDLAGGNLKNAYLRDSYFFESNLSGTNLSNTNFTLANLIHSNFSNSNLTGADFKEARVRNCNFSGANLKEANLSGTFLNETQMDIKSLDDLRTLDGVSLIGLRLSKPDEKYSDKVTKAIINSVENFLEIIRKNLASVYHPFLVYFDHKKLNTQATLFNAKPDIKSYIIALQLLGAENEFEFRRKLKNLNLSLDTDPALKRAIDNIEKRFEQLEKRAVPQIRARL